MDNLVEELTSDGHIKKIGRTKIYLTDDGRKRAEIDCFMIYTLSIDLIPWKKTLP